MKTQEKEGKRGKQIFWSIGSSVLFLVAAYFVIKFDDARREIRDLSDSQDKNLLLRIDRITGESGGDSNVSSLKNRIRRSTVIVLTEVKDKQGKRFQTITEIHKLRSNVEFFYQVGDGIGDPVTGATARQHIHFYRGSPASEPGMMSIHAGYLLKQKDLPLRLVRDEIERIKASLRPLNEEDFRREVRGFRMPTLDQAIAKADYAVLATVEVRGDLVHYIVTEIYPLKAERISFSKVGEKVETLSKLGGGMKDGDQSILFYKDGLLRNKFHISKNGRLIFAGGLSKEIALKKLRKTGVGARD